MQQAIRRSVEDVHRALFCIDDESEAAAWSKTDRVCARFGSNLCEHLMTLLFNNRDRSVALTRYINRFTQLRHSQRSRLCSHFYIGELLEFANVDNRNRCTLTIRNKGETVVAADDDVVPAGASQNLRRYFQIGPI